MHAGASELVERCAAGELSPAIALVRLLVLCGDGAARARPSTRLRRGPVPAGTSALRSRRCGRCWMRAAIWCCGFSSTSGARPPVTSWRGARACSTRRCGKVRRRASRSIRSAARALLEAATAEVVALLERLGVLGPERWILEIGCGIGRFQQALAGRAAALTGIDIAPGMIAEARRRCAGLPNVTLMQTSGLDLGRVRRGGVRHRARDRQPAVCAPRRHGAARDAFFGGRARAPARAATSWS